MFNKINKNHSEKRCTPSRRPKQARQSELETLTLTFENEWLRVASLSRRLQATQANVEGNMQLSGMWDMWINAHLSSTQSWTEEMRNAKLVIIVSLKEDLGSPKKR